MTKHIFWLASYPKSGNTLLRAILSSLFFTENGVFNFKLLEMVIKQAIGLHKYLPQHPDWKKLKDELNKDS